MSSEFKLQLVVFTEMQDNLFFFFSSRRRHTRSLCDWSSDVCSSDLMTLVSGDPFGLFQITRHISATSKILVYPPTVPIYNFVAPTGLLSGGDAQRQDRKSVV